MENNLIANDVAKTYIKIISLVQTNSWSVQSLLDSNVIYNKKYPLARIGNFLIPSKETITVEDSKQYKRVTVKINNGGVILRDVESGINIGTKRQYITKSGQFILSRIDARNGAFGIIPDELDGAIVTNDFPLFDVETNKIIPQFLVLITTTKEFIKFAQSCSSGTTNRQRMDIALFLDQKIPLPSINEQENILKSFNAKIEEAFNHESEANKLATDIEKYIYEKLGIVRRKVSNKNIGLKTIQFEKINEWGLDKILSTTNTESLKFPIVTLKSNPKLTLSVFRGKSPVYSESSSSIILNQKCNRWNELDLSFVKTVDDNWLKSIDKSFFTKVGDVLINSTGEGTIGRASYISENYDGFLYDSHLLLLRLNLALINPEFFVEIFNSNYGQSQVNEMKSAQATKQTELGINNLFKINFPLPEIAIQHEIVENIKAKRNRIATLRLSSQKYKIQTVTEFEKEIFGL